MKKETKPTAKPKAMKKTESNQEPALPSIDKIVTAAKSNVHVDGRDAVNIVLSIVARMVTGAALDAVKNLISPRHGKKIQCGDKIMELHGDDGVVTDEVLEALSE